MYLPKPCMYLLRFVFVCFMLPFTRGCMLNKLLNEQDIHMYVFICYKLLLYVLIYTKNNYFIYYIFPLLLSLKAGFRFYTKFFLYLSLCLSLAACISLSNHSPANCIPK